MLTAEKGNKVLSIEESEAKALQVQGFDIYDTDEKGKRTLKHAGAGKTVPYEQFAKLEKELAALKTKTKE